MRVQDIVNFSKDSFFNGAVQTEWFYDKNRFIPIAKSYVFHGPKYYGVTDSDVRTGTHKLIDTASFAKKLTDKLYDKKPDNSFVMTIAGYGTGKSHLAVCLGALFSGDEAVTGTVTQNIISVDPSIGNYIKAKNTARNFVIVLNGMNNFNLDAEVLRCARLTLQRYNLRDDLFRKLTKSYDIAKHFVERNFLVHQDEFNSAAEAQGIDLANNALMNYLLSHLESDNQALEIINSAYEEINGDKIAWDRGLSAGDVLLTIQEELCGEGKPFNKVLLLFDEFGRYIEYTAAYPAIAGEAALQQIFEAVQTANGNIIFTGFIQSELQAYLSRIDKTSNITRYIDRYRTACENLFLSTNFETILANILNKVNPSFDRIINASVNRYSQYYNRMQSALSRWDRSSVKKSVWTSPELFNSVIIKGCYPLHPITVWLLSGSHQWMQQRSTLAFAAEMFESISRDEINENYLPYIYPYQITDSGIFNEMLNSEEKGLVSSQYCMLYRSIIIKVGDKLSYAEKTVLKSILVMNIGHMSFFDKKDAIVAIKHCSNLNDDELEYAIKNLEEMHGVIAFDDHSKTFDLIAEASGFNDFSRILSKYRLGVQATIDDLDEDVIEQLGLAKPVETSFGQDAHIYSTEWFFVRKVYDSATISEELLRRIMTETENSYDGEKPRGILIYAYCNGNAEKEAKRLSLLYKVMGIAKYPIIILFLNDADGEIITALKYKKAIQKFSVADQDRFHKHIAEQLRAQNNKISRTFTNCVTKRLMVGESGLETYNSRINALCTECFSRLFTKTVPFLFDGFENKTKTQANTTLISLCVGLLNHTLTNEQVYSSLTPKDKNRVTAVLSTKGMYAWKVFNENCVLVEPANPIVRSMFNEALNTLDSGERYSVHTLFSKYLLVPYGMNENSLALFVCYFIAYLDNKYIYTINNERLSAKHWTDSKGKLVLPEIRKICIQKNANVDTDLVGDLCRKILTTVYVELCPQLKKDLDALVQQEGETPQNKYIIAQAYTYLDEGIRIYQSIKEKIGNARTILTEAQKTFNILKLVKVFDLIPNPVPNPEQKIEEGYPFEYSDELRNSISKLRMDLVAILEERFFKTLPRLKCEITELSQFKNYFSRAAKILREQSFEEYACALEKRITEIEKELLAKQHYENSLVECQKDLTLCETASNYQQCSELKKKLQGWLTFFKNASDLPASIVTPLLEKLESAIRSLDQYMQDYIDAFAEIVKDVQKAEDLLSLRHLDEKLYRLMQMHLPDEINLQILSVRDAIRTALAFIEKLPKDIEKLTMIIEKAEDTDYPYCSFAIIQSAKKLRSDLIQEENEWIENYIVYAENEHGTMSPQDCTTWLESTKTVPLFFSSVTKERYKKTREIIEDQLHSARVAGVLSMYDSLTPDEKEEFRKLLAHR